VTRDAGFFQLRRGIWEHVRDGRMTLQDVAVHQYIASQADTRTGIWNGSAGALSGELCISPRMARRFIERLTRGGYIRRFPVPGRHICYPILVHKFLITEGEHKGEQLNAIESKSPDELAYFAGDQMSEQEGEHKGEPVTSQKRIKTLEGRLETEEGAPASPSPRFSGQYLSVSQRQDAALCEAFPWADRQSEYQKADRWIGDHPNRAPRAVARFLRNWFSRIDSSKISAIVSRPIEVPELVGAAWNR
jgi:hypothetical protein